MHEFFPWVIPMMISSGVLNVICVIVFVFVLSIFQTDEIWDKATKLGILALAVLGGSSFSGFFMTLIAFGISFAKLMSVFLTVL